MQPKAEDVRAEIRAELGRKDLSHADLARKLGISRQQLSTRMRGETEFKLAELVQIAELLGLPVTRFVRAALPAQLADLLPVEQVAS